MSVLSSPKDQADKRWIARWLCRPKWFRAQRAELEHQIEVIKKDVRHDDAELDSFKASIKRDCEAWLEEAEQCLSPCSIGYAKFDEAWSSLREIRHKLCWVVPKEELVRIAQEIRYDLEYVTNHDEKEGLLKRLDDAEKSLLSLLKKEQLADWDLLGCRAEFATLSMKAGTARQAQWHKLNLLRGRLTVTGLLLGTAILLVSAFLVAAARYDLNKHVFAIVGVVAFGTIGGLVSSLRQQGAVGRNQRGILHRARIAVIETHRRRGRGIDTLPCKFLGSPDVCSDVENRGSFRGRLLRGL